MDMRKEFPSQTNNRWRLIAETVRENQSDVWRILMNINSVRSKFRDRAIRIFNEMHKQDQKALLEHGGILTDAQIQILSPVSVSDSEPEPTEQVFAEPQK